MLFEVKRQGMIYKNLTGEYDFRFFLLEVRNYLFGNFRRYHSMCWLSGAHVNQPSSYASVAQLVEQLICNQLVGGSSPSTGSHSLLGESGHCSIGGTPELESRARL